MKAKGCLFRFIQLTPIGSCALQQIKGANDIGLYKLGWTMDGAIDMAFSSEIDNRSGLMLF